VYSRSAESCLVIKFVDCPHNCNYPCVEFSVILLFCVDASGIVRLWHFTSGKVVKSFNDGRQVLSVTYNPDETKILTTGTDPLIHMYDASTFQKISIFQDS